MNLFFLDSSAVVKRYGQETGSTWVKHLTNPTSSNLVYLARITAVEVVSALARKARSGGLAAAAAATAIAQFRLELPNLYRTVEISASLITKAMSLAETHTLRGYDAVQLAATLEVNSYRLVLGIPTFTLVSADIALNAAAILEGLSVDDPNAHP